MKVLKKMRRQLVFVVKVPLWILAFGGTWGLCFLAVVHWNLNRPLWAVAPTFIVVATISQLLCAVAVDMFGDRARG